MEGKRRIDYISMIVSHLHDGVLFACAGTDTVENVVGDVARVGIDAVGAGMGKDQRRVRDIKDLIHGLPRYVGEINHDW